MPVLTAKYGGHYTKHCAAIMGLEPRAALHCAAMMGLEPRKPRRGATAA